MSTYDNASTDPHHGGKIMATHTERVVAEVLAERHRQMHDEAWTPMHDDKHTDGEIARAAACYALNAACADVARNVGAMEAERGDDPSLYFVRRYWPWENAWWKPKDRRRDLIRAAALIVAEIERLDRAAGAA